MPFYNPIEDCFIYKSLYIAFKMFFNIHFVVFEKIFHFRFNVNFENIEFYAFSHLFFL